jgi:hypothetical protein
MPKIPITHTHTHTHIYIRTYIHTYLLLEQSKKEERIGQKEEYVNKKKCDTNRDVVINV